MKHNIKMLKTEFGCDEGVIYPTQYVKDETYEVGQSLLNAFIEMGACELVQDKKVSKPTETKVDAPKEIKKKRTVKKKAK